MSLPDEELISAFLDDELSPEERVRAEQLLTERADLRRLLDDLRGLREGLRALPSYALGEEFGSLVMRRAEREMLRGDAGQPLDSLIADAPAKPQDREPPAADKIAEQKIVDLNHADRWRRPAAWALIALAAALVITVVERGMFAPRDGNVALKPADQPAKQVPAAPEKLAEDAGKLGDDRATFSKEGAAGAGGFRAKGDAGVMAESLDAKQQGVGTSDTAAMGKKLGDAASPANNDVAFGATRKDGFGIGGGRMLETEEMRGIASGGAAAGEVVAGQGSLAYGDLAGIAQNDFNRALTIAAQVRAMESETQAQSRRVSAVQLQQRLAQVEEANDRSRRNVAGEASSQQFSNAASPAEGLAMKAAASPVPGANLPQQVAAPTGAAGPNAGQLAQNEQLQEKQALRLNGGVAFQTAAPAQSALSTSLGRNVLVVTVEGTEEAITKVFAPALRREQIADLNNSWQTVDASFASADSYDAALQSAVPPASVTVSNAATPQDADLARALARRAADKSDEDAVKLGLAAKSDFATKQNVEAKSAGEKQAVAKAPGSSSSVEYFYVVAPEGSLEAAIRSLRAEASCVLNLTVEPGPTTPVDESRWASYNRGGATTSTSLAKPEATSAVAAKPAAVPPPAAPAAAAPAPAAPASVAAMPNDSRSETAPKSKVAASTTPAPATAAAPVPPSEAPAAKGAPATSANVANGSSLVAGGILSKSGAGTLVLGNTVPGKTAPGERGLTGSTTISGSSVGNVTMNQSGVSAAGMASGPIVENKPQLPFGTGGVATQQIVPTSPALSAITPYGLPAQVSGRQFAGTQQILPMSRAQRLSSRQVAVLESAALTATAEPNSAASRPKSDLDSLKREAEQRDGAERTLTKNTGETSGGLAGAPAARPGEPLIRQQERAAGQEAPTTSPPFVWSFAQSSPPLPADYREAIFVFRVVSPEEAKPVMSDAQTKDSQSKDAVQRVPLTK